MGWFDMIRRLEKKVINGVRSLLSWWVEKRMAQSGGYDLSDPFIDDGNLVAQHTTLSIPEPPPFQVMRYNAAEAGEDTTEVENETTTDNTKRRNSNASLIM